MVANILADVESQRRINAILLRHTKPLSLNLAWGSWTRANCRKEPIQVMIPLGFHQLLVVTVISVQVGNEVARDALKHSAAYILRAAIAAVVPAAGPLASVHYDKRGAKLTLPYSGPDCESLVSCALDVSKALMILVPKRDARSSLSQCACSPLDSSASMRANHADSPQQAVGRGTRSKRVQTRYASKILHWIRCAR